MSNPAIPRTAFGMPIVTTFFDGPEPSAKAVALADLTVGEQVYAQRTLQEGRVKVVVQKLNPLTFGSAS